MLEQKICREPESRLRAFRHLPVMVHCAHRLVPCVLALCFLTANLTVLTTLQARSALVSQAHAVSPSPSIADPTLSPIGTTAPINTSSFHTQFSCRFSGAWSDVCDYHDVCFVGETRIVLVGREGDFPGGFSRVRNQYKYATKLPLEGAVEADRFFPVFAHGVKVSPRDHCCFTRCDKDWLHPEHCCTHM